MFSLIRRIYWPYFFRITVFLILTKAREKSYKPVIKTINRILKIKRAQKTKSARVIKEDFQEYLLLFTRTPEVLLALCWPETFSIT